LLAILLITVGIFMGIETFVFNKEIDVLKIVSLPDISSDLSIAIINLAKNSPIVYASLSVVTVMFVGFIFSYIRELIHHFRYSKKTKS
jgi:hypothetical protein